MALRDLAGAGADCGPVNPLAGLAKHLDVDRSLQRDVTGQAPRGPLDRLGRQQPRDDRFADEFFGGSSASSSSSSAAAASAQQGRFGFRDVRSALDEMQGRGGPGGAWADEFGQTMGRPVGPMHQHDPEFEEYFRQAQQQHQHPQGGAWQEEFFRNQDNFRPMDPREFAHLEQYYHQAPAPKITELTEEDAWAAEFGEQQQHVDKGKEKAVFTEAEQEINEEAWQKALDDADLDTHAFMDQLENEWSNLAEVTPETFSSGNFSFGERKFEEKEYEFESDNVFMSHPNPYEEGLKLMDTGNLSDAALAFEAAVQQNSHHTEAWLQLGLTQAENEKEDSAIRALQRAVREDPSNMATSLALAVSYTNEGAETQAFDSLEQWIRTKYTDLPPLEQVNRVDRHDQVVRLYLTGVQRSGGAVDPDVQVGLGVLFNISCEYDKAVDCFQAALQVRPDDYLLWNRLGATMANSGRSEEAISAYYQALERKPSFVRARYNLGVSCINMGFYSQAAEHLLGALAMHGGGSHRNVSNNLWDTLRRTFGLMQRRDLVEKAATQDLALFKPEFDF